VERVCRDDMSPMRKPVRPPHAPRHNGLAPRAFEPLPLGQIRPAGWLRDQLQIQANGLTGHLHEFWPDVARSQWIGGDVEGWERGPYWLDGLIPLATLLDDARPRATADYWVERILASQRPDGWLGPVHDPRYGYLGVRPRPRSSQS
jgi:hypothetical protein